MNDDEGCGGVEYKHVYDISAGNDWNDLLQGMDVIVHLASKVHEDSGESAKTYAEYWAVNVKGTENIARAAVKSGIKRFIFVSTVKVNGDYTDGRSFTENDHPRPRGSYAKSKWEAENVLRQIQREYGLEVVIIRPPLVYGPRVAGNFLKLLRLVKTGIPLPLGGNVNVRSMISVGNLTDLISLCISHERASDELFLASDRSAMTVPEIIKTLSTYMGKDARLFPLSKKLLECLAIVAGQKGTYSRLCSSLEVDSLKAERLIGWTPPEKAQDALRKTAEWFSNKQK